MTDEQKQRKLEANRAYRERQKRKKAEASLSNNLPTPEAESNGLPVFESNREKAEAVLAESTARAEYVEMLFSPYAKNTNIPQLLQSLIREIITLRVTLVDLMGGRK